MPLKFDITVSQSVLFEKGALPRFVNEAYVHTLDTTRRVAVQEAKRLVPVGKFSKSPGALKKSIHSKMIPGRRFEGRFEIIADAQNKGFYYGHSIEKGRGSVEIKNSPYLIFRDGRTGKWLRKKSVGPAKKRSFLEPAVSFALSRADGYFQNALTRSMDRFARGITVKRIGRD